MSVATWSLRERAVWSLPAGRADQLGEPPLHGHVHVLVVLVDLETALLDLLARGDQAPLDLIELPGFDDPLARQHPRVGQRAADVLGGQAKVKAHRGVQRAEQRVLRVGQAGHARRGYGVGWSPVTAATWLARITPSRYRLTAHPA